MSTPTDDAIDNMLATAERLHRVGAIKHPGGQSWQIITFAEEVVALRARLAQAEQERDAARCAAELLQGELSAAVAELRAVEQERDAALEQLRVAHGCGDLCAAERDQANNEVGRLRDLLDAEREQSRGLRTALERIAELLDDIALVALGSSEHAAWGERQEPNRDGL